MLLPSTPELVVFDAEILDLRFSVIEPVSVGEVDDEADLLVLNERKGQGHRTICWLVKRGAYTK